MRWLWLILLLVMSGCGSETPHTRVKRRYSVSDPVFYEFMAICESRGGRLADLCDKNAQELKSIRLVDSIDGSETSVVGACITTPYTSGKVAREIKILRAVEASYAPIVYKSLLYHELGHCLLDLDHDEDMGAMMYAYVLPELYLTENWDALVAGMFDSALAQLPKK